MEKEGEEFRERCDQGRKRHMWLALKMEDGGTSQGRRVPLEAENSFQLTASREMGTAVLEPQRTEFCQQCE